VNAATLSAWAAIGTLLVIAASVVAALVQLRHMRAGNELEGLLTLERDFRDPQLQSALIYIQERLPQRLEDPLYRRELETIGFIDPTAHPEMVVCNWLNKVGTLVKHGLVSEEPFMDIFARLISYCWKEVAPAVAIMRRTRGEAQYHDLEFLAARAAAFLDRNPHGTLPRSFTRGPLADRWGEADSSRSVRNDS
jgi:hypothetical protein